MALTATERTAGRYFRKRCSRWLGNLNASAGAASSAPYIVWYRHECMRKLGTQSLHLRQHYWQSPLMAMTRPPDDSRAAEFIREGRFLFVWREGTCSACQLTVRSGTGHIVLPEMRALEKGAVNHGTYQDLDVPQGQGDPARPS